MKRRRVLTGTGVALSSALGGCLGDDGGRGERDGNGVDDGTGAGGGSDDGETDGASPGRPDIEDIPCPPYETDRDSSVCSHTVDAGAVAVSLEASPERSAIAGGAPADEITLTLRNRSTSDLTFNPYSWRIWRDSGTGWDELREERSGDGHLTVSAGDTHSWTFGEAVASIRADATLEPGLYAAEIGVPDPTTDGDWIACIALVQLTAAE